MTEQLQRRARPRRADVRERLLDAALELFLEHGYDGTSLDQVAARAGFTKGAVYSNFSSKDELFLAMMDARIELRVRQVREVLQAAAHSDRPGQLVGDRLTASLDEDHAWQLLHLDYVLRAARDPQVRERFVASRRHIRGLIADAVRDLVGPLPDPASGLDAEDIANAILALSNGLGMQRLVEPETVPDDLLGRLLQALQPPGMTVG